MAGRLNVNISSLEVMTSKHTRHQKQKRAQPGGFPGGVVAGKPAFPQPSFPREHNEIPRNSPQSCHVHAHAEEAGAGAVVTTPADQAAKKGRKRGS